jgi:hypothetical protein
MPLFEGLIHLILQKSCSEAFLVLDTTLSTHVRVIYLTDAGFS